MKRKRRSRRTIPSGAGVRPWGAPERVLQTLREPRLLFGLGQAVEDPRDGLTLFGPLDAGRPYGIRAGVVGTARGIELLRRWVEWAQQPVQNHPPKASRPPFPGFEAAFRLPWHAEPVLQLEVAEDELARHLYLDDRHQRIFETVEVFTQRIQKALLEEESKPDIWFVVIPQDVWKYGRPQSTVAPAVRQEAHRQFGSVREAKRFVREPSLFEEQNIAAAPYGFQEHFRNQLKARLLKDRVATQIVREQVLSNVRGPGNEGFKETDAVLQSAIAWHLGTAAFYKAGGRPWKAADVRDGVCYLGLVFKQDTSSGDARTSCCAAQMFLDSGDGVVFKGAVGPWYSPKTGDYHLSGEAAYELVSVAIRAYREANRDRAPGELFIHGRVAFDDREWRGFQSAAGADTRVVGVKIRPESGLKMFRWGANPVLRGTTYLRDARSALLWTRGWIPRLQTYPGRGVPNPLRVDITHGQADLLTVLRDILTLTKLNYNACVFSDGVPITLKFADAVGAVLTAGPIGSVPPLPFMYYI